MKVKIELPFSGFYNSVHDLRIDDAICSFYDYDYETGEQIEVSDKVQAAIWNADINWRAIQEEYCKHWLEAFSARYELDVEFDELWMPKAYNMASDRLFATIPSEQINKIRKEVEAHKDWPGVVKNRYTSYDGFSSNYESDVTAEDWTRPILDECQYETMLGFWLEEISPDTTGYWSETEYFLTEDFEMTNWDSINNAYELVEQELEKV